MVRANVRLERGGAVLDQPQPQMDMPQQASLVGLSEARRRTELPDAAEVVQKRGGEEQIYTDARMQLRRLAADGRDPNRVLEQSPGIPVVSVGCRRE